MRAFNRFLLAGTSHLAILMMGAGGAWAWDAAVVVNSGNSPYTSSSNVTGPNAANGASGAGAGDAGADTNGSGGNSSVGIHASGSNTSVSVTGGTVSAGRGGDGGVGPTGFNGGRGGDSVGMLVTGSNVNVTIGANATVSGGTAGDGGTGSGGQAAGGNAFGLYVFGANATIVNNGTINGGTGGIDPTHESGDRTTPSGISVGNQTTRTSTNVNITNNGTINQGVEYYTTGNTITNNGTINGWVSGDGNSSATIINNGAINNSGDIAVDFYSEIQESTFTNNGTVTGGIQLGVISGSGDHVIYLNKGSTLNGDVRAKQSGEGNVVVGNSGAGVVTLNGNLGELGTYLHSVTIANGATLKLGQDTIMSVGQFHISNGGTIDLQTNKFSWLHYNQSGDGKNDSGSLYFKTTINTTTGKHGYIVFTKPGGTTETTYMDGGAPTIYPVVVGTVTSGSKYVIVQDTDGRVAQTLPSVVNGSGYRWTVSQVTGSGQTDTDGISYGNGYTNIIITAASQNAAGSATGTNGSGVRALATYSGSNAGMQALSQAVNNLTNDADIKKAGAQLRPETTGNTAQASMGAVTQALSTIQVRTDAVRVAASETGTGVSSGETLKGLGVWGQGFGSTASQGDRNDVSGYDADTYGLAFGADFKVLDPLRVGLSFAYAKTNVDSTGDRSGSGQDIDSYITSLYGTYSGKGWYVDGALTYGIHKYDATRHVAIAGAAAQDLKTSYDGQQVGAKAEVGMPLAVGPTVVTPLASLAYNNLKQDSYAETGGAAALQVGSSSTNSIRSGLGAKVSAKVATIGNWEVSPNARAVWHHEFNKSSQEQTSTYVAGGSSFITPGTDIATEHFNLGLGVDVASVRNTTLAAKYDADLADKYVSHSASLQLRTEF